MIERYSVGDDLGLCKTGGFCLYRDVEQLEKQNIYQRDELEKLSQQNAKLMAQNARLVERLEVVRDGARGLFELREENEKEIDQLKQQNEKLVEALGDIRHLYLTDAYREKMVYKMIKEIVDKTLAEVKGESDKN
jgi:phosphopentomutase